MEGLKIFKLTGVVLLIISIFAKPAFTTLIITADKDLRFSNNKFRVESLGLSLRKVFVDEYGDRIILFTLIDSMHNFQKTIFEQVYLQYKGPLGRWNLIFGRFLLPFGLLPNYSTKRLLIESLESKTIGICSDQGLKISGLINDFDYAISLTLGTGVERWTDIENNYLITKRFGYQGIDFEDLKVGLSGLLGKVFSDKMQNLPKSKQLLAIDLIKYYGPMVGRAELVFGKEENESLTGVFAGLDYTLFPKVDLNLGYTYLRKEKDKKDTLTIGLTYNLANFQIRAAKKFSLGGKEDGFFFQAYRLFSWTL